MTRIRPRALRGASLQRHAALAAWNRLQATPAAISKLEIWRETARHQPASVYRLELKNGPPSVFAKRCDAASCEVERMCYEEIVPRLALSSPAYYGSVEEPDGTRWVFLEDVGRERLSAHDPTHRALASRWIARLHSTGAQVEAARRLPEAGPPRYLQHLRDGRGRIRQNLDNPALTAGERGLLLDVLATLDRVEAGWDAILRACAGIPETVVHGDFRPKNVRIRQEPTGPVLYPMDWELAGWGIPVADLAPARGADETLQVDPELYAALLRGHGPALEPRDVERLSLIGFLLRKLAAIDWETLSLPYEDPMCLMGPMLSIQALHRALTAGLTRAAAWLR